MDYRYLLYFEREARFDVLERLAAMAADSDPGPTTLVLPGRNVRLPFADWDHGGEELRWDAPDPWNFMAELCFPPDPPLEDYARRQRTGGPAGDTADLYDDRGRVGIGYVYLEVRDEPATGSGSEDLVRFCFGTPGSSMSVLFLESQSIRDTLCGLLEGCRGVYGLFDMEDYADLIWLRGARRDDRLPTAALALPEIEELVVPTSEEPAAPLPFSFAAEQVVAAAKHHRRAGRGTELCVNHWQVALYEGDEGPAAAHYRQALARGEPGRPLSEDQVRDHAARHAREQGRGLVGVADVRAVVRDRDLG